VIQGHARHGTREWTFRSPCLTTWEIVALGNWLEGLADPAARQSVAFRVDGSPDATGGWNSDRREFAEPNLAFQVLGRNCGPVALFVELRLVAREPVMSPVMSPAIPSCRGTCGSISGATIFGRLR
jgi:hypothetical protein